jgi:hypothetical protein
LQKLEKMFSSYAAENCKARENLETKLKLTVQESKDIYRMNMKRMLSAKKLYNEEQLRVRHEQHKRDAVIQLQHIFNDVDDEITRNYLQLLEMVQDVITHILYHIHYTFL